MLRRLLVGLTLSANLFLAGCGEQPRIKVETIEMVSKDTGSPDFRRMAKICFDQALTSDYYHEIVFESKDGFVFEGSGKLRAAVSDPDNLCIFKNLNQYVTKTSPPRARELIDQYLAAGNVSSVKITVWGMESGEKGLQMDSKVFKDL